MAVFSKQMMKTEAWNLPRDSCPVEYLDLLCNSMKDLVITTGDKANAGTTLSLTGTDSGLKSDHLLTNATLSTTYNTDIVLIAHS